MTETELKAFLDEKAAQYEHPKFLEADPIQIPHQFTLKEDIEISAFLTATIAWGNRKSIINNAKKMMGLLDNSPYDFILNHESSDLERLNSFVHRTFNGDDLLFFVSSLKNIYCNLNGLEAIFTDHQDKDSLQNAISAYKTIFFGLPHQKRTQKHVSDPLKDQRRSVLICFCDGW